jgi:GNAT superfamily N-acetyltransferase
MRAETADGLVLTTAGPADEHDLLALARVFHAEDDHPLSAAGEAALGRLLRDPSLGFAALLRNGAQPVGYAVICYGFSIEWGGRDAFLDDLYIAPDTRGAGVGQWLVETLVAEASRTGVVAIHLEIMPGNPAERLYERLGFADRGSRLMTRLLFKSAVQF